MMVDDFSRHGLAPFLGEWRRHDMVEGKSVALCLPDRVLTGKAVGIDEDGALLLESGDGIRSFVSGDVSLQVQM
jgi:BirA family biotin operon repressor/biotin-[acetyl-CoA-carboxylase] ligase